MTEFSKDCGFGSDLQLVNLSSSAESFSWGVETTVYSGVVFVLPGQAERLQCAGVTYVGVGSLVQDTDFSVGFAPNTIPYEQMLMGFAGLLCGFLIAWAIARGL